MPIWRALSAIVLEALLFFLFWETLNPSSSSVSFYLYVGLSPAVFAFLIIASPQCRVRLKELALSKDLLFFLSVLSVWIYIYALVGQSIPYIFSTLYFPVLIEELNFRFVILNYLSELIPRTRAVIVQAVLYTLLYSGYLFMEPGSYPGIYGPLFLLDMLSMGLVYGGLYYMRKNLYLDITVHSSLWLMAAVVPGLLIWIPYTLAPT